MRAVFSPCGGQTIMKLTIVILIVLGLIATKANAESTNNSTSDAASPKHRYFDSARGPNDSVDI